MNQAGILSSAVSGTSKIASGTVSPVSSNRLALFVACCSSRKAAPVELRPGAKVRSQQRLLSEWLQLLGDSAPTHKAEHLYVGRAFSIVRQAAATAGARLGILSAGLGFVRASRQIPSYSITSGRGPDGLEDLVETFEPTAWWRAVSKGPFSDSLNDYAQGRPVILIALTAPYARLVAEDLEQFPNPQRLRIFGLGLSRHLPTSVAGSILGYDESVVRLRAGTKGDFAARALMLHAQLFNGNWDRDQEFDAVRRLKRSKNPSPPPRRTATDDEILKLVSSFDPPWSASSLLRRVRASGVACAASRMDRLIHQHMNIEEAA